MLVILLFYCIQELGAFSGVLTCLNYLPCVLITVKPNNTCLPLFISLFYLAPTCFHTNMFLFITVFLMTQCPELKITKGWQYCCCRAAQRWRWHDRAPLAVFSLLHCHTARPFLICRPWLATLPLLLCLSHWRSVALNFVFILSSFVFSSHPFELLLIFFHVRVARKFLLGWWSHFLHDHQHRCKSEQKKIPTGVPWTLFLAQSDYFTIYFSLLSA